MRKHDQKGRMPVPATITCKITHCAHQTTDDKNICDYCWTRFTGNVKWLHQHVNDLEYRLNPANGKTGEHSGNGNTPIPMRAAIYVLLYEDVEGGNDCLLTTLHTYLRCLDNAPYREDDSFNKLFTTMEAHKTEWRSNGATPAYAPQFNYLASKARRILEDSHEERMDIGICPNSDCNHDLNCPVSAKDVKCPYCGSTWSINYLRRLQHDRLVNDENTGTQTELLALLRYQGIAIKQGTLRKWCSEGDIKPVGHKGKRKTYLLGDVYKRAVKAGKRHVTSVWDLPGVRGESTES